MTLELYQNMNLDTEEGSPQLPSVTEAFIQRASGGESTSVETRTAGKEACLNAIRHCNVGEKVSF